jgi:hypothetical protein
MITLTSSPELEVSEFEFDTGSVSSKRDRYIDSALLSYLDDSYRVRESMPPRRTRKLRFERFEER